MGVWPLKGAELTLQHCVVLPCHSSNKSDSDSDSGNSDAHVCAVSATVPSAAIRASASGASKQVASARSAAVPVIYDPYCRWRVRAAAGGCVVKYDAAGTTVVAAGYLVPPPAPRFPTPTPTAPRGETFCRVLMSFLSPQALFLPPVIKTY